MSHLTHASRELFRRCPDERFAPTDKPTAENPRGPAAKRPRFPDHPTRWAHWPLSNPAVVATQHPPGRSNAPSRHFCPNRTIGPTRRHSGQSPSPQ